MGLHIFPRGINPKGKLIVWLYFKLAYNDFAVQYLIYYAKVTISHNKEDLWIIIKC